MMNAAKPNKDNTAPEVSQSPLPSLKPGEVLIKVAFTALNRADLMQVAGKYPTPPGATEVLGLECAGVVEKVTKEAVGVKIGDTVMCLLPGGGNAQYAAAHSQLCMHIPSGLSLSDSAGIVETWLTAFQMLNFVANIPTSHDNISTVDKIWIGDKKLTVLVHAAGSGVGTALIQLLSSPLFNSIVSKIVATAGNDEKLETCKQLAKDIPFAGYNRNASQGLDTMTKELSNSVDLILDPVGISYVPMNLQLAAPEARWVIYGSLSGMSLKDNAANKVGIEMIQRKRLSIIGTTLRPRTIDYKAALVQKFSDTVLPLFVSKEVHPIIDPRSFTLEQIKEGHEYLASNQTLGKVIISVNHSG